MEGRRTAQPGGSCVHCRVGEVAIETHEACPFAPRNRLRDELIYLQGERATSVWLIKRGVVVLRRASTVAAGRGIARCVRTVGALIGVEALLGDSYADSAEAGTTVTLCGASRDDVQRWLGTEGASQALLESSVRAGLNDGALKSAREGSVVERVAAWYLEHEASEDCRSLSRGVVADLLGVRPETLSRSLAELVKRGALSVTRSGVSVADREILLDVSAGA